MSAVLMDMPVSPMVETVPSSQVADVLDTDEGVPPAMCVRAVMLRAVRRAAKRFGTQVSFVDMMCSTNPVGLLRFTRDADVFWPFQ